ncbi:hypothetical protein EV421DRAFT_2011156 [Armillaria borealis]|uniref:C2H2-type domain-containing protein n=1 Tax=Armillaria borealis TaxID=47425 RepID=A0AA39MIY0_9AGAR|nr:hypothetical protein EV421DRAFT_2011156 [Armillaria borealis]
MSRPTRRVIQRLPCPFPRCNQTFKTQYGRTQHINSKHTGFASASASHPTRSATDLNDQNQFDGEVEMLDGENVDGAEPMDTDTGRDDIPEAQLNRPPSVKGTKSFHPYLTGRPCDQDGVDLPDGTPPMPMPPAENAAAPFEDSTQFRIADFLFRKVEMSQGHIDELMELWTLTMLKHNDFGPFENHTAMNKLIDEIKQGSAPWKCFVTQVEPNLPPHAPSWQRDQYQIWYRDPDTVISNILSNPDFCTEFDASPYVHVGPDGKRRWCDFMSGNYAWKQSTRIYTDDPSTEGAMYVAIILGSDKTTVSVATGNVEYHPLYISIVPIGFLAIPKGDRKYDDDPVFRLFKKQLYHSSIAAILDSLKPAMTQPIVRLCPDGHYRRVIYDLGAFIADYPEQVLLSGIVSGWCAKCTALSTDLDGPGGRRSQELTEVLLEEYGGSDGHVLWHNYGIDENILPFTFAFPRADIYEILTSDLLHQVIKGTFKDHLVEWVGEYLVISEGKERAKAIMDDIDRRIAATPAFPGLRRFPQGRRFKQWTGDDSKALMKVYLPAVAEYLPEEMMQCLASFMDFCYLVRRTDFDEETLNQLETTIAQFHARRQVFITTGVRDSISLPRQHSLVHYRQHIINFGAPNGLCSSITESRHITAVKKPWRRSNRYNALSQMLLTNQRLDKLTALRAELASKGLVAPNHPPPPDPFDVESEDAGAVDEPILAEYLIYSILLIATLLERVYPRRLGRLAAYTHYPQLPLLTRRFLYDQLRGETDPPSDTIALDDCPEITSNVYVYHSAVASFYAPSDISGIRGMRRERIRCTPSWHKRPRHDCAFVVEDENRPGFSGMSAVRVLLFFSFTHDSVTYPCALVHWFKKHGQHPDKKTGLWVVKPDAIISVVHLDSLLRGAHLIPVYGSHLVPFKFDYAYSLDCFRAFYVNKYADHHSNEIVFS